MLLSSFSVIFTNENIHVNVSCNKQNSTYVNYFQREDNLGHVTLDAFNSANTIRWLQGYDEKVFIYKQWEEWDSEGKLFYTWLGGELKVLWFCKK